MSLANEMWCKREECQLDRPLFFDLLKEADEIVEDSQPTSYSMIQSDEKILDMDGNRPTDIAGSVRRSI